MGFIIFILIVAALVILYQKYNSPNARAVRKMTRGKTEEQKKTIEYFCRQGCMAKTITDAEYIELVRRKRDSINFYKRALDKIGLDEDEVKEIKPVCMQGFVYDHAYIKKNSNGKYVSSSYQVSWIFFSSSQIHLFTHTFNMDEEKTKEYTEEFFYKDVTSFRSLSEVTSITDIKGVVTDIPSEEFAIVVPGDKFILSMGDVPDAESVVQGMKQKLREKKSQ